MEPARDEELSDERNWADLPHDLVRKFASGLTCDVDRMSMVLQCRAWRDAIRQLPRSKQLPWMLVPFRRTSAFQLYAGLRQANFFCFQSARAHRMPIPSFGFGSRFVGAVEGGWVVLALGQNCRYTVMSFRTGSQLPIPDFVVFAYNWEPCVLRAAAFSCHPSNPASCVVACIVSTFERPFLSRTLICFSRIGATVNSCALQMEFEDVIYFVDSFYCLMMIEDMVRCTPEFDASAPPDSLHVQNFYLHFDPTPHDVGLYPRGRYLVSSRDELLMVVRYSSVRSEATESFGLFRVVPAITDGSYFGWQRLPSLDGRMIFVARGCSTCYEAADFPGRHEGVYFLDDKTFSQATMVAFGQDNGKNYECHDNGCWPGPKRQMKRWYDWRVPLGYTPPMWFLP